MDTQKPNIENLYPLIREAIRRLPDGECRFISSENTAFKGLLLALPRPTVEERLLSDYEVPAAPQEIEKQYFEEISLIEQLMIEEAVPVSLADWQARSQLESVEKFMKGLNRRAYAIQLWSRYAIPWRHDGSEIHIIFPPSDVMGTPLIHTYSARFLLLTISERIAEQHLVTTKLRKKLQFWDEFKQIVLLVLGGALVAMLLRFFGGG